jgi:hypothetical protein
MLPESYVISKFHELTLSPRYNKVSNTYFTSCPICREGKSYGKKRRLYYLVDDHLMYCQNCGRGWSPLEWISAVSGMTRDEVLREVENYEPNIREILAEKEKKEKTEKIKLSTLPEDSINLTDPLQIEYYKNNPVVQKALEYIKSRRLDTAKYKPKTLWISLKDKSHKNRLCIPFYDLNGQIIFYQTRAIFPEDDPPKYKGKTGADKSLFNVERIDPEYDTIYLLEGPIKACFVKNAVGICGISFTDVQNKQLYNYPFHKKTWVLDNDIHNEEVYGKLVKIIERGERVFLWPKEFKGVKDTDEVCIKYELDEFPAKIIEQNTFQGDAARLRLAALRL